MITSMDTDGLKAFLAVAEHHSFSVAAQHLFITQPAVSKRIAALEQELNHILFDRLGRDVALTEAGQALLPRAQAILNSMHEAQRTIREFSGEIVGTLRVATSHHIGLHHLPPILREFAANHKQVNLQFDFLDSEQAHEKVLRGDCDLAVVTLAPTLEENLEASVLWPDPLCFIVGANHPLATSKNISLEELSQTPAILPDLNTYTGRLVKHFFDTQGLALNLNMATNYLETIKMMVTVGLGWSVLPKTMVDSSLKILPIKNIQLERQLGVVIHKKRTLGNAARAFFEVLSANSQIKQTK